MIDLKKETPMRLSIACKHRLLESLGGGEGPPHPDTVRNWCKPPGIGGIILESIKTPRGRCTSEEAIVRFFERLTYGKDAPKRRKAEQDQAYARAEAELRAAGF